MFVGLGHLKFSMFAKVDTVDLFSGSFAEIAQIYDVEICGLGLAGLVGWWFGVIYL